MYRVCILCAIFCTSIQIVWSESGYCDGTVLQSLSIRAVCAYNNRFMKCPNKILPGTEIQINCAYGYTRTPDKTQSLKCLPDGTFNGNPMRCEHKCGRVAPYTVALSKNGIPIESSLVPWHVAIYENNTVDYDYICSGSIISPRIVITAAHCFWDAPTLTLNNVTDYKIIAGRTTREFPRESDEHSQIAEVAEIHVSQDYRGRSDRQRDDIAFVKLKSPIIYGETKSSICLPERIRQTASNYVSSNMIGFISGFGLKNQLERFKMITLAYHDCLSKSPAEAPIANDKFCIYNNDGGSVCRGDSGASFFTENRSNDDENEIIYRLLGIISNTPTTKNDCTTTDDESYVAITSIHYISPEFKAKLEKALREDETLF